MLEQRDKTTSKINQIGFIGATDSRNEFFNAISLKFNGDDYQELLDDLFRSYVVSDQFCELEESDRIDAVYYFYQMKEILSNLGQVLVSGREEVSCEN